LLAARAAFKSQQSLAIPIMARSTRTLGALLLLGVVFTLLELCSSPSGLPRALVVMEEGEVETAQSPLAPPVPEEGDNFFSKVFAAAAQGCTAAFVAAILSAMCEPLVNRLLVKRMTVGQAFSEMNLALVARFFLTTFPTNMLKFPVFEVINRAMAFSGLSPSISGTISGFFFCTIMLPVTNYRFQKSMNPDWEIQPSLLYQAYVPTVARDIIYGWARGLVGTFFQDLFAPEEFTHKALVFGLTIWASCIISSPCNEWRGYTLQPPDKKLDFQKYFKPINYARSTGIGSTIMGVALMIGMLVTPYAEAAFGYLKENHPLASSIVAHDILLIAIVRLLR